MSSNAEFIVLLAIIAAVGIGVFYMVKRIK